MPEETQHILSAIASVMDDVRSIEKAGSMNIAGSSYRFRRADDVMNAVGEAFRDHAVMLQTRVIASDHHSYDTEGKDFKGNPKTTHWTRTYLTMSYRFTSLVDGSTLDAEGVGEGLDSGDKSSSKAMTGALKYALTQALQIAFKDMADPDNERPETQDERETDAQRVLRERREAEAKAAQPEQPTGMRAAYDKRNAERADAQTSGQVQHAEAPTEPAKLADDGAVLAAAKAAAEQVNQAEADAMAAKEAQHQRDAEHQHGPGAPDPAGADTDPDADPMAAGVETLKTELGAREIDSPHERERQADEVLKHASDILAQMHSTGADWPVCTPADTQQMGKALAAAEGPKADRDMVNKIIIHAGKLGLLVKLHGDNSLGRKLFSIRGTMAMAEVKA